MSAIVAVLTNPSLVQALTAYQDGVARHLSCICHRYRKQLARWARVQRHSGPAATILASPARFRCYVLFQLIKRGQFEEAHELIDEVGEEAFETPEDGHAPYLFALDKVAGCGDLALVQFLSERRLGQCTSTAMDDAAANGVQLCRLLARGAQWAPRRRRVPQVASTARPASPAAHRLEAVVHGARRVSACDCGRHCRCRGLYGAVVYNR
ncbi:hypothetical protein, variant [Saprolegnia diclina VS20]|uniref:Uncharacterized protein n=1 Tax=Saprolegnia diclina (strain VS20) TaxID=1156394 RepID=T0QH60_SAPDV|nr:hypothetical protein, variant [Saprolegnia diclina VS20]EQC34076.1 hypothetical protein, variant [Saprolegnia diclina VS20]|eukprot:XP_008612388.1 hypothetical protein, variant [Saprolegnia diclina VS20]